jgi:hypothetical protein
METDPNILAIAHAALARFGEKAAECMDKRARNHRLAGEDEGSEFWARVAAAVRERTRRTSS